jgi:hypothetical protein
MRGKPRVASSVAGFGVIPFSQKGRLDNGTKNHGAIDPFNLHVAAYSREEPKADPLHLGGTLLGIAIA